MPLYRSNERFDPNTVIDFNHHLMLSRTEQMQLPAFSGVSTSSIYSFFFCLKPPEIMYQPPVAGLKASRCLFTARKSIKIALGTFLEICGLCQTKPFLLQPAEFCAESSPVVPPALFLLQTPHQSLPHVKPCRPCLASVQGISQQYCCRQALW